MEKKERNTREKIAWENSPHFAATPPLVSPRNDVRETSEEIPYWWRLGYCLWLAKICFNQSEALPRSGWWRLVISMDFSDVISRGNQRWRRLFSQARKKANNRKRTVLYAATESCIYLFFPHSNFCCSSGYVSLVGGPLMTRPLHVILTA